LVDPKDRMIPITLASKPLPDPSALEDADVALGLDADGYIEHVGTLALAGLARLRGLALENVDFEIF
jgi:hypothetical protein